jgi:DNA-binding CsgD family transcriptional regulator
LLVGRDEERARLGRMIEAAREGRSAALLVHGEAGMGKTTLLRDASAQAHGMRLLRARGIESESELPFAALSELLSPLLELRSEIPPVQAQAIGGALALEATPVNDRFAVAAGVLSLLAAAAERQPVLAVADDLQWLDEASREALLFAARRLDAEGVVFLFGLRDGEGVEAAELGIDTLPLRGLDEASARALLAAEPNGFAPGVIDQLVAASAGNPLALREIPRGLSADQRAGRDLALAPLRPGETLERAFRRRVDALPEPTRDALLVAACAETMRADVIAGALANAGYPPDVLEPAEAAGLLALRGREVEFDHPLVRAAVYHGASPAQRRDGHTALAAAFPDRSAERAWHRAAACSMPDAGVAQALMEAAGDARGRAAFAAAARGFARAGELHVDDDARARALLEAAGAATIAGELSRAVELAERGAKLAADPLLQADLRAMAARTMIRLGDPLRAGQALVREAERIEGLDRVRAGTFLLESAVTHMIDGTLRAMAETAGRVKEVTGGEAPGLEFLATLIHAEALLALGETEEGDAMLAACEPVLLGDEPVLGPPEVLGMAAHASLWSEQFERAEAIFERLVGSLRDVGAAGALVYPLAARSHLDFRLGRWPAALAGADEAVTLARETHQESLLAHALGALAEVEAGLGRTDDARAHANQSVALCQAQGAPATAIYGYQALALLELGLGNLETARDHGLAAERAFNETEGDEPGVARYAPDLLEVLWRLGLADEVPPRLAELERQGDRPHHTWVNAIVARIRGLMAPDDEVDAHFARAVELHDQTRQPFETARTQLLHGERLRRAKRRADARGPLGHALTVFERLGAEPWAERARGELRATGGPTGSAAPAIATDELTAQELQIALQVAQGRTNREVAAALFLSAKTIEYHLGSIYRKLGIRRRTELSGALAT